ncbi:hypothetical protein BU14_0071s0055 [Porphyra umbilicalis]|uniref:Uncharacterized protein n=1 Tax=Porphyra umbilicalis TaxID=2786 RepID=A0A1X6PG24_PORUM|nr:hypothetical protein BU14_0071s0055 [Porphyra umbilicalis]|eukprot:OSX79801.1 hypothetical protein BU14_0071s0055 [Porphyra umbilicalis]
MSSAKSGGLCCFVMCGLGAITMAIFGSGMNKEYAFFGYEGDFSEAASLCFRTAITFAILSGLSGATFVAAAVREKGLEVSVPPPLAGGEELSRTGGNGGGYRPV